MEKIITLFQRDYDGDRLVFNAVVPGAEWVTSGEGIATRKYDGTCCLIRSNRLFKRYELKPGKKAPDGFEPATVIDPKTGKQQGWVPVGDGPDDRRHQEAFDLMGHWIDGTYELCGPKVQGNPEGFEQHELVAHDRAETFPDFPRDFEGIKAALENFPHEGVVWHHPDGRMVKIKKRDFYRQKRSRAA